MTVHLTPAGVRIERVGFGHPDAMQLIEEVQAEYVARYGSRDDTPLDPVMFDPPDGSFFVLYLDEDAVATGAWRRHEPVQPDLEKVTAEIKRMYVIPGARGKGFARQLLAHLEETAGAAGFEVLVLETGMRQPEAIALYESSGYRSITGFGYYRDEPLPQCFAKQLPSGSSGVSRKWQWGSVLE